MRSGIPADGWIDIYLLGSQRSLVNFAGVVVHDTHLKFLAALL